AASRQERRVIIHDEKAKIDDRGGEHVVEAEARWRHLANPLLYEALPKTIEQESNQSGREPDVERNYVAARTHRAIRVCGRNRTRREELRRDASGPGGPKCAVIMV